MRHFTTAKKPPTLQERFRSRSPEETNPGEKKEEKAEAEGEEEDDYMNMTFTETTTLPETSLQRRQRLHAQGLKRGAVPSKAELLAQERARREEGLARSLLHPEPGTAKKSKGLAMMAKMGFKPGSKLGAADDDDDGDGEKKKKKKNETRGAVEPLRIEVRQDRGGIGLAGERKRKLEEAVAADEGQQNKQPRREAAVIVDPLDYRDRMARERDAARKETLVGAAQKIAERMDEDRAAAGVGVGVGVGEGEEGADDEAARERKRKRNKTSRPLRAVPVLYRGLVRHREEKERDRRMRHDLETSLGSLSTKLPTYEDEGMDADDKLALGKGDEEDEQDEMKKRNSNKKSTVYMTADDLDEEDEELDEWEALEVDERLKRLVWYLRKEYRYCFWCKFAYPDESMEGCPGVTEEDHD